MPICSAETNPNITKDIKGSSELNSEIIPLITYINADLDKKRILKENRKKTGVYRWVNKINGNTYVGSSINLTVRLYTYFSIDSLMKNTTVISKALIKYGYSNFKFEILEYCDKDVLLEREQYYLDLLNPIYNVVKLAGNTKGYKHTPASLEKMRSFILSDEAKAKKAINVVKYATAAKEIPVIIENVLTGEKKEYLSIREAALDIGVPNQSLSYCLRKNSLYKKIYLIRKKD